MSDVSQKTGAASEESAPTTRIWKNKRFKKFADEEKLPDAKLCDAVDRANRGNVYADLKGGLIKQKVARPGKGKSGGYRTLICFKAFERAFFVYGFAKNERDNISPREEQALKELAKDLLSRSEQQLAANVKEGELIEVFCNKEELRK